MNEHFSVFWWDSEDNQHRELHLTPDFELVKETVTRLTKGPAARIGAVRRVIITDDGDNINFEWQFEKGLIYPTPEMIAQAI